jgi:nucleoid-associated protein YgaU
MTISKARIAADLLGVDVGGGELERLTITYESAPSDPIRALFNPNEISLSRSLQWEQQRQLGLGGQAPSGTRARFRYVEAETFSIELFFDTYESRRDVRRHTEQLAALTVVNPNLHRPPICQLRWGAFDIFTGVLTSLSQRFTLFLEDGTPVRATVSCSFLESVPTGRARSRELHSADVTKVRQVRRGDTLQSVAAEEYNDPRLWRAIATANRIVNPRQLAPGTVLMIPKLQS